MCWFWCLRCICILAHFHVCTLGPKLWSCTLQSLLRSICFVCCHCRGCCCMVYGLAVASLVLSCQDLRTGKFIRHICACSIWDSTGITTMMEHWISPITFESRHHGKGVWPVAWCDRLCWHYFIICLTVLKHILTVVCPVHWDGDLTLQAHHWVTEWICCAG